MKTANINRFAIALAVSLAGMLSANIAVADIVVDPKGHEPMQLQQDQAECRDLANSLDFDMASEHQGRAVLRGAVVMGGMAAIAGGDKEMRRRSAGAGALGGALVRNKSKRVDSSMSDVQRKEAQRNCLYGRGYNPLN